jgi:DNA-binding CsgD family transcriptional regulator
MSTSRAWPGLRGRARERGELCGVVTAVRAGDSCVLVLRGEPGIGKTALLEFLVDSAAGCRVARAAGVESEMELPYASLHQLCRPYLDRASRLPPPQHEALRVVFGQRSGGIPDRFLVGLAVLTLLCAVGEEAPLLCVVDDVQWLDRASAQTLEFVARRLGAEPVGMVFAARPPEGEPRLAGLPELVIGGLSRADAAGLLEAALPRPLDSRIRDRVLEEAQGNPLALLELPRGLTTTELVFGGPGASAPTDRVQRLEQGFSRQLGQLPAHVRQLLLTAAAEPVGDGAAVRRAAGRLGIRPGAAGAAETDGLVDMIGDEVRFRQPLVRSAVYRSATPAQRRQVHRALAEVTDPAADPDRRAWHRARAAVGTDEAVAAELDHAADRAFARGGVAAAAALLETSAALTPEPGQRARRRLAAAGAKATAGSFEDAARLLEAAEAGPLDEPGRARLDLLRAQVAYNSGHADDALPLLLTAARRWERLDGRGARETYLAAFPAALSAGRPAAGPEPPLRTVATVVRAASPPEVPRRADLLLDGLAVLHTDGYAASAPLLHRAVRAFGGAAPGPDEGFHGLGVAAAAAVDLWDDVHWDVLSRRHLDAVRKAGALGLLPLALAGRALFLIHSGNLSAASSLVAEGQWIVGTTGGAGTLLPLSEAWLAAVRGDEHADPPIQDGLGNAFPGDQGVAPTVMQSARAVLCNGLGRYEDALEAAQDAAADPLELGPATWALAEVVEAGARTGDLDAAARGFRQLAALTRASGTELARGVQAARGALLERGGAAEELYREGIDRLGRTRIRVEWARAGLRYGEWLRRQGRRVDARAQLRSAYDALAAMGVEGFAERARRELLATGETVRKRTVETPGELTAQEAHIAQLAADGLTNPEIAARLYLSPRTVEWHLRKVFTKQGLSTRRQLRRFLHQAGAT